MKHFLGLVLFTLAALASADHGSDTWVKANRSVVSVLPTWPGYQKPGFGAPIGSAPEGSGVVFSLSSNTKESSYILTAAHVVADSTKIAVRTYGDQLLDARVEWVDLDTDLALLAIDEKLPPIALSQSLPIPGTHVCALGNPFGLGISMSCGVISGPKRRNIGFNPIEDFLQTDAAVNPGSSGGALVNAKGELVGLISAIFTKDADIDAGVNFAISSELIIDRLNHFLKR